MSFKLPAFKDLNQTQKTIISLLPVNKVGRMAVIGGPGTGKTIIGLQAAALMAESKKKCLFLSYSVLLRDFIKNISKNYNIDTSNIEVDSYLRWLWNKLIAFGYDKQTIETKLEKEPYVYDLDALSDVLSMIPESEKKIYDYIFIDEAQDLQDGLVKILLQFCDNILVTYDDSQKVGIQEESDVSISYDHSNLLIDLGIGDKFFDLIDNYRNTMQIETVAKLLFTSYDNNDCTLPKITSKRSGARPKIVHFNKETAEKMIDFIVDNYDSSKSVAIIINRNIGNDNSVKLREFLSKKCKAKNISFFYKYGKMTNLNSKNILDNGIFLLTDVSSKGLEFDDVCIIPIGMNIDSYQGRNSLYVSITRAKSSTTILLDEDDEFKTDDVYKLFDNKKYLFNNITME